MMRVAQVWQTGPVDVGMAVGYGRGALVITESRTALQLENIALRHQIGVLQRSTKKRLNCTTRTACSGSGYLSYGVSGALP